MPPRSRNRTVQAPPKPAAAAAPSRPVWLRPALMGLTALLLLTWFTGEIADTDIWLHLKTGQHTLETHALTVPDPFSYTSNMAGATRAGEAVTRYFNLTHEWLAQIAMYGIYSVSGFPGLVLLRAVLLIGFCWLVGLMAYWRSGHFYRGLGAAIVAGAVAINFQQSRPFLVTFVLLAATMAILEARAIPEARGRLRRALWLLPAIFLFWANCHGGFFLGWAIMGAYCGEALILRRRKKPVEGERQLWLMTAICFLISGVNPNGFRVIEILFLYRGSPIQARNLEWQYPAFWEPSPYSFVLFGALAALLIGRRKTRPVDWLLYGIFAPFSLMAVRNTIFMGIVGPILVAALLPSYKRAMPLVEGYAAEYAAAGLLVAATTWSAMSGGAFQLRAAEWQLPSGAADFMQAHQVSERMFNMYAAGGYLVWRLWPMQKDFIDPRGLSEEAFADYNRMLVNTDFNGGKSAQEVFDKYGIQVLVLEGFDRYSGQLYNLPVNLADPNQTEWKLVYSDVKGVVFMRHPPAGVQPLNSLEALHSIELQCQEQMRHDPARTGCARAIAELLQGLRGR